MPPLSVVALLWSVLVLAAADPASASPTAAVVEDTDAALSGDSPWRWTAAGLCPHFCTCSKRRGLRLAECAGHRLAGVDVGMPANTEVADLSYNLISVLEDGCFQELGLVQLRELHLQHNAIRTVGPWALAGLRRLRLLDLSYNHLQTLYPNTFAASRGLNTLRLAGNNLARLPADQPLPAAPRLQVLDLSSCRLAHLGAVVLSEMPALASLNLSDNYLIQLQPQALAAQPRLQLLDLTRNPLACDVNTRQSVRQLEARNVTLRQSCPAEEKQGLSKSVARILADVEGAAAHGGEMPHLVEERAGVRPGVRTHEEMVAVAPDPAPGGFFAGELFDGDFVDGELVAGGLDEEEQVVPETTVSPSGHKNCMTLFPEGNSGNPILMSAWFDPIPSFWASVAGFQIGLVLGMILVSSLCSGSLWRALCGGGRARRGRGYGGRAARGTVSGSLGLTSPGLHPALDRAPATSSTPCLWRDSFTSLEALQQGLPELEETPLHPRPETPPPAYEDLRSLRGRPCPT